MSNVRIYRPESESSKTKKAQVARSTFLEVFGHDMRTEEIAQVIRDGFLVTVVDRLQDVLDAQQVTVLKLVRISPATFTRRRAATKGVVKVGGKSSAKKRKAIKVVKIPRLSPEESGRVYRVTAVVDDAVQLFEGNREAALRWLKQPAKALNGVAPLDYLDTEAGADAIRDLIGRLEHGVIT